MGNEIRRIIHKSEFVLPVKTLDYDLQKFLKTQIYTEGWKSY